MWDKNSLHYSDSYWRLTLRHPHNDRQWQTNAKLGSLLWCPCELWWHPFESKLLPPLHPCKLIWHLYPTYLIECISWSWMQSNQQHTNAKCLHWSASLHWWLCASTDQSTFPDLVRIGCLTSPRWVCQWMGSHACAHWHPCFWTPMHVKPSNSWWVVGVPHSSSSVSRCVPSTLPPLTSSSLENAMGLLWTSLSIFTCDKK